MSSAADREIIAWAREHRRTVVTLDADFHAEMAVYRALNPSVIRLRFLYSPFNVLRPVFRPLEHWLYRKLRAPRMDSGPTQWRRPERE